jgi:hypothetical protein
VYRGNGGGYFTGFVPVLEAHINTPLNHRGTTDTTGIGGIADSVVMTTGAHIMVAQRGVVTLGYAQPLTGPKPFNGELVAQFGFRY